jgi:predicted amidohydrolase
VKPLNIALLQIAACGAGQEASLAKGEAFCRRAAGMGADIALFPEMWNVGYRFFDPAEPGARERWAAQAIPLGDRYITHFQALARDLKLAIALTYLEQWPGAPRNTVALIDRHGDIRLTYAKVHTCDFDLESALTPGEDFYVAELETGKGSLKIGAMICYDREFPESARILMLKGAEVILTPNACELEQNRLAQFRARAMENMLAVAMANYAAPDQNGHSVAYDGIAFQADERSRDMLLVEAGEREGVYLAELDLDSLRAYRERESWGNAFRRPRLYGALTAPEVQAPFQRLSARR